MNKFDENILKVNSVICDNISKKDLLGEGLMSQNILAHVRNLVDAVALRIYSEEHETEIVVMK